MRLFRPPLIFRWLYPDAIFRVKTAEKILFLTFDDGPDPDSTPFLLDILERYSVKAVFFCTGKAAAENPELFARIISRGHIIGNHSYSHLKGWKTPASRYCEDVHKASGFTSGKLFRPPYGQLSFRQYYNLRKYFRMVFWDIMPYDFDKKFSPQNTLEKLQKMIRPGSVIVLHDTSSSSCNKFLDEFLAFSLKNDFSFNLF